MLHYDMSMSSIISVIDSTNGFSDAYLYKCYILIGRRLNSWSYFFKCMLALGFFFPSYYKYF